MKVMVNSVLEFEGWKRVFRDKMENQLTEIFNKTYAKVYSLTIIGVDKWNVEFMLIAPDTIGKEIQNKLASNDVLKEALSEQTVIEIGNTIRRITYKIEAKTEEELNSKLMYINLMF